MAEIISTVDFDLNTDKAAKELDSLIKTLQNLDKELKDAQAAGKDTTAINAQIAKTTQQVNAALNQTVKTQKGATAQVAALNKAEKDLAKTNIQLSKSADQVAQSTAKVSRATQQSAGFLARSITSAKNATAVFSRGAVAIGNLAGGFGLAGIALSAFSQVAEVAINKIVEYFNRVDETAEIKKKIIDASQGAITSIVEETRANNGLFEELKNTNTTQERRREIVAQLQTQYPDIIGKTDLLTASETELKRIQDEVNANIRRRILIQAQEAQTAEIVAKIAKNQAIINQDLVKSGKDVAQIRKEEEEQINRINAAYEREVERLQQLAVPFTKLEAQQKAGKQRELELAELRARNAANLDAFARQFSATAAEENRELTKQLRLLGATYKELDFALEGIDFGVSQLNEGQAQTAKSTTATKKNTEAQKALAGTLAALREEQARLNKELEAQTKIQNVERINLLGAELRIVNAQIKEAEENIKKATEVTEPYVNSLSNLRKAAGDLRRAIDEQIDIDDIETLQKYRAELNAVEAQIKAVENAINGVIEKPPLLPSQDLKTARAELEVIRIELADLAIESNRALLGLQERENAAIKAVGDNEKEKLRIRKEFAAERERVEREFATRRLELQIQSSQAELAVIQAQGDAEIAVIKEKQAQIAELQRQLAELSGKEYRINIELNEKEVKDQIQQIASFTEQLAGQVFDFLNSTNQAALQNAERAISKQEALLNSLLNTQEDVSAEQVELERERLEKLNKEREKAKDKEAKIAQAQIAINLALAVARAVAEGGGIASAATVAAALAAAAFGFLQAKQASAQAFYEGTLDVQPNGSHKSDSFPARPKNAHPSDTIPAYLSKGEAIIPTKTNKAYHPAVEAIYKGSVPADVLNGFVRDYSTGRVASAGAIRLARTANVSAAPTVIYLAPDESIGKKVAQEIQKIPQMQLRGDGMYKTVRSKSSRIEKVIKRAKGH